MRATQIISKELRDLRGRLSYLQISLAWILCWTKLSKINIQLRLTRARIKRSPQIKRSSRNLKTKVRASFSLQILIRSSTCKLTLPSKSKFTILKIQASSIIKVLCLKLKRSRQWTKVKEIFSRSDWKVVTTREIHIAKSKVHLRLLRRLRALQ